MIEARISHLAYAPEIASAMLQRQRPVRSSRHGKKSSRGQSAWSNRLWRIKPGTLSELDDERKAQMVSNLLVVLCSAAVPQTYREYRNDLLTRISVSKKKSLLLRLDPKSMPPFKRAADELRSVNAQISTFCARR